MTMTILDELDTNKIQKEVFQSEIIAEKNLLGLTTEETEFSKIRKKQIELLEKANQLLIEYQEVKKEYKSLQKTLDK